MCQISGTTLFSIERMPCLPEDYGEVVSEPIGTTTKTITRQYQQTYHRERMARIMQVNMAGLSTHSSTALSFYLNQGTPHAVILTETHRELAAHEINNYSAIRYCGTTGQGGVSILVRKDITHVSKIFNARLTLSGPLSLSTEYQGYWEPSTYHQPAHRNYKLSSVSSRKQRPFPLDTTSNFC